MEMLELGQYKAVYHRDHSWQGISFSVFKFIQFIVIRSCLYLADWFDEICLGKIERNKW